jgi:hypothetical protein
MSTDKTLSARKPEILRCQAGGCEYLTRGQDGRLRECGQEATFKGNTARGLRYCSVCVEYVRRGRHGIEVRELQPHERRRA